MKTFWKRVAKSGDIKKEKKLHLIVYFQQQTFNSIFKVVLCKVTSNNNMMKQSDGH